MSIDDVPPDLADYVERLHETVDELVRSLAAEHAERLRCGRGCSACCVDDLSVFEVEAAVIARRHSALLASGDAHAIGACAFLDGEGACRIYPDRPYVCRTQGLPLRWLEPVGEAATDVAEARDICALNVEGGPPLEDLSAAACWTIGPIEDRLATAQSKIEGGAGRRVRLRSLFSRRPT